MNFPTPPIETRYDYYKIIPEFKKFASQYIGKNYLIPDEEKPIVFATIAWMLQDDLVAKEMDFDLQKGILLSGPIGCGKTTLFKLKNSQKFNDNLKPRSLSGAEGKRNNLQATTNKSYKEPL